MTKHNIFNYLKYYVLYIHMSNFARLRFRQKNLASDIPNVATYTIPDLINPWGIKIAGNIAYIADNKTLKITLHMLPNGSQIGNPINVLGVSPTGLVLNNGTGFLISNGGDPLPSRIIVATETGTIEGYNENVDASNTILGYPGIRDSIYKGLELFRNNLYATNFGTGYVDKINSSWQKVKQFTDQGLLDKGYYPFNCIAINGRIYVTFAKRKVENNDLLSDDEPGLGNGYISVFDTSGNFIKRFANRGPLNSPWGLLPWNPNNQDGCNSENDEIEVLLVGNFGNGAINIYDLKTGGFIGPLKDLHGNPITIDGLWGLVLYEHGNFPSISTDILFTAGINHEDDGLFGVLQSNNNGGCCCEKIKKCECSSI
ncbi:MAG: TIGR03118 family protein [Edafosvirus sp.]|uniref:TIGR03118 family protein n=1 Tax=Edafosvirus sp. TaxID=2487765 RepID=A0A3G4ZVG4_9VIRU|nr:MAG: TIGR03118 family protein [Edafosvirus sp.]